MQERSKGKTKQVDIMCVSPVTGAIYSSTVTLPRDTPGISDVEDYTSESSRRLRREVKVIYKEVFTKAKMNTCECDDEAEADSESYEKDLRRCKKVSKEREGARSRSPMREKETTDENMEAEMVKEKRTRGQSEERSTACDNRKQRKTYDCHE